MATTSSSKRQLIHTSNTYESNSDLTVGGDLFVNGATTTIDTANLLVEDKNIIIGNVSSPSDTTADGGGITLKGASDYTINWTNSTNQWYFNQGINITGQLDVSTNLNVGGYGTLAGLDINGNSQFDGAITVGVNDTGHDVKFFGATSGRYLLWDESANALTGVYDLKLADSRELQIGGSNDLRLYHSHPHSYIVQGNSGGSLYIRSHNTIQLESSDGEDMITCTANGAVTLHYDAASHLQTTQTGVNVTGTLGVDHINMSGELNFTGNGNKIIDVYTLANSNSFTIRHHNPTGNLFESAFQSVANGATTLYYDGAAKFATTTDGIQLYGNGYLDMPDNGRIRMGTNQDFAIYHNSSDNKSVIEEIGSGNLSIRGTNIELNNAANNKTYLLATDGGSVQIRHNDSTKLETTSTGATVTGRLTASEVAVSNIVTNKVVKFNGTLLDDSIITDNGSTVLVGGELNVSGTTTLNATNIGGNVGIGTTTPTTTGGTAILTIDVGATTNKPVSIANGTTDLVYFRRYTSGGKYQIQTVNGSSNGGMLSLQSYGGDVGVGTTAPRTRFHVVGPDADDDPVAGYAAGAFLVSNSAGSYGIEMGVSSSGAGWIQSHSVTSGSSQYDLYLNPIGGNVGIGTSSPQEKLHVDEGYILADGASTNHGFELRRDSSDTFQIRHLGGNFTINNLTDNRKDLSIDGDGNVGIGTASPDSPLELEVATAGSTQTRLAHFDHNPTGNTGSGFIRLSSGSNNLSSLHIEQVSSGGGSLYGTYSDTNFINNGTQTSGPWNNINFVTNETIRMTIGGGSQAGNVGIGTTTPSRTLHVVDSAGPTIKFQRSASSDLEFTFGTANASIISAGEIQFRANGGTTNKFVINNSQIQSNAKFLVNTSSGIDVHTNDSGNILLSGNSSATGTPDQFFLKHNSGGVELGNSRGDIKVTKGMLNPMFSDQGGGLDQEAMRWSYFPSASGYYLSLDTEIPAGGVVRYHWNMKNNGTAYDDVMVFDRGDVGIGTASPVAKLDVDGQISSDAFGPWYSTDTYIYDSTDGLRYFWNLLGTLPIGGGRGSIEYECKNDENYPHFVKGTIGFGSFDGGSYDSTSIQHDQQTADHFGVQVRLDSSRRIWIRIPNAAWGHFFRFRVHDWNENFTTNTSWSTGTTRYDTASVSVPPNSSSDVLSGQNLRVVDNTVTGSVPTYDTAQNFNRIVARNRITSGNGAAGATAYGFNNGTNTGMYLDDYSTSPQKDQLNFSVDGSRRLRINEAGTFVDGNSYVANGYQFRTFQEWLATTGGAGYGFKFRNTADAIDSAIISNTGTLTLNGGTTATGINLYETYTDGSNYERTTFDHSGGYFNLNTNKSGTGTTSGIKLGANGYTFLQLEPEGNVLINGADDNGNKADFAVGVGTNPRVSWHNQQVQIGGNDMNYNGSITHDVSVFRMQSWNSDIQISCHNNSGSSTKDIYFIPFDGTTSTEAMRIKGDGKVGIGTNDPLVPLHVQGTALSGYVSGDVNVDTMMVIENDDNSRLAIVAANLCDVLFGDAADQDVGRIRYNHSANSMAFFTNGSEKVRIESGGDVGIGTTNPVQKLQANGNIYAAGGHFFVDNDKSLTAVGTLRLRTNNGTTAMIADTAQKVGLGCAAEVNSKASVFIKGEDNSPTLNGTAVDDATLILTNSYTSDPYGLCFGVNTSGTSLVQSRRLGSETYFKLSLNPYGGNVGIGTDDPVQELEVDGVIKQKVYTVSTLPSAGSGTIGARAFVSDSYYAFSSSYLGSQISGGGSNFSPVYSDGNYWYMG